MLKIVILFSIFCLLKPSFSQIILEVPKGDDGCFQNIDLLFVLDGSGSVKEDGFKAMMKWVKEVAAQMHISNGHVQLGVIQYSQFEEERPLNNQQYIVTEVELGSIKNESKFNETLDKIVYKSGGTSTAHALQKAIEYDFVGGNNRYPDAQRVIVLVTDGAMQDKKLLPSVMRDVNKEGIIIYAVGVGDFDKTELLQVTNNNESRVFNVSSHRNLTKTVNDLQVGVQGTCDCNPAGSINIDCDPCSRECDCKAFVEGRRCDRCKEFYYGIGSENGCKSCNCDLVGTKAETCEMFYCNCTAETGQCDCLPNVTGRRCQECVQGTYGMAVEKGCIDCGCNFNGTVANTVCDQISGQCECKEGYTGRTCSECELGFNQNSGECVSCSQKIDLMLVLDDSGSVKEPGFERIKEWVKGLAFDLKIQNGNTQLGVVKYSQFQKNYSLEEQPYIKTEIPLGEYSDLEQFDAAVDRMKYKSGGTYTAHALNKTLTQDFVGPKSRYPIAKRVLILLTDGESTDADLLPPVIEKASQMGVQMYAVGVGSYNLNELRQITSNKTGRVYEVEDFDELQSIAEKIQAGVVQECDCNPDGSVDASCDVCTGVCSCKSNVIGRRCDRCAPFYYGFGSMQGCQKCKCNSNGTDLSTCVGIDCQCSSSGQCSCLPNVHGLECDKCIRGTYRMTAGRGCIECGCDELGTVPYSICDQTTGFCECKKGYTGKICNQCKPGYQMKNDQCVECPENIDMMLVIDQSGSVFLEGFQLIKKWVKRLAEDFQIDHGYVQLGVVKYSKFEKGVSMDDQKYITTEISLGNYSDLTRFKEAVDDIKYLRGETYTAYALNKTLVQDFNSKNSRYPSAKRVLILLTDGVMDDKANLPAVVEKAQELGVVIFAIGVKDSKREELLLITNNDTTRVFQEQGFEDLDTIVHEILNAVVTECDCDPRGSLSPQCDNCTRKCPCKHNVAGRRCNRCTDYHWNFGSDEGCKKCHCNLNGTDLSTCQGENCNCSNSGQCECLPNVRGMHCNHCVRGTYQMQAKRGCIDCECDPDNSIEESCNQVTGQCKCKHGYTGRTCTECDVGYRRYEDGGKCTKCTQLMDLVLLVDSSKSVQKHNFDKIKIWIKNLASRLRIDLGYTQIGVVRYSQKKHADHFIKTVIKLGQFTNLTKFDEKVDKIEYTRGKTDTAYAINKTLAKDFVSEKSRYPKAKRTLLLVTDGQADDKEDLDAVLARAKDMNVAIFAVGINVNGSIDKEELLKIVDNNEERRIILTDFDSINKIVEELQQELELTCDCDLRGSVKRKCDNCTGQCLCLPHVINRRCSKCESYYYDFGNVEGCQKCACNITGTDLSSCENDNNCNCTNTGQCRCLPNVTHKDCSECVPGTYQMKRGRGCIDCQCHKQGTMVNTTCDKRSGDCRCVEGYRGQRCSECDDGYVLNNNTYCIKLTTTTRPATRYTTTSNWSPCRRCSQWPGYCRGWICRRRWPYYQQYPSYQRCYAWDMFCRSSVEFARNYYNNQQDYFLPHYVYRNRPSYYRGYNHHPRSKLIHQSSIRYSLYKN